MKSNREIQQIVRFAGVGIVLLIITFGILTFTVPFEVTLTAIATIETGEVYEQDVVGNERTLTSEEQARLDSQERLVLPGGSTAQIELWEDSNLQVFVLGPASWELVSAQRRGTAAQHILGEDTTHTAIIEQNEGTAVYDLSGSEIEKLELTIRTEDREFSPEIECFQVTAASGDADAPSTLVEVPCNARITPIEEAPPPSLP